MNGQSLAEVLQSGRGVERPFRCHVHDDSNASASVNVQSGLWICYACGATGKVDEAARIPDEATLLRLIKGEDPPRTYAEAWLDLFDADHPSPYWAKRFGRDTARYFRCGTHYLTGEPTYPIRDAAGTVLGVVTRHEGDPKYKYPFGARVSATFFGDIKPASVIVLVEGAGDVMALHQEGIPDGWTVLGCYGAGLHAPQVQLIRDLSPQLVIAAYDDDNAGHAAMQRAEAFLADVAPCVSHRWGIMSGKDPGEIALGDRFAGVRQTVKKTVYRKWAA